MHKKKVKSFQKKMFESFTLGKCPNSPQPQQKLVSKSNKGDIFKDSVSLAEHFPPKYQPNG